MQMELIEGIRTRRSVRKFTDQEVTKEQIEEIVEIARFAPSWKNSQSVRYMLILNKEIKDRIASEAVMGFDWNTTIIKGAPALILVNTVDKRAGYEKDGTPSTSKGEHWQSYDAGIASATFCLAAFEKGLASVILGIYDEEKIREIAGVPEGQKVSAIIPIGYANEEPQAPRRKETADLLTVI